MHLDVYLCELDLYLWVLICIGANLTYLYILMLDVTVAHKCHGNKEKFTTKKKSSRQKRKAHGKKEKLTAKEKSSRQKKKAHGKREKLTAKTKSSRQKRKARGGS